jgi:hypothetical protein
VIYKLELAAFGIGLLLFSIGLSLIWFPLGLIGGGAVLMGVSMFGGPKEGKA